MDNRDNDDAEERTLDDPLGIADAPVPQDANDIHATNDPTRSPAARAQRARARPMVR